MTAVPFDTLKLARALRDQGKFTQDQAEGMAQAFAEAVQTDLATKGDISTLASKSDIARLDGRMNLTQWMLGFVLAFLVAIVMKLFLH